MSREHNLPFERGETFWGGISGDVTTLVGAYDGKMLGQEFEVHDGSGGTGVTDHGTGAKIVLRVMQNVSGGNLNSSRGVSSAPSATSFAQMADTLTDTQGEIGWCVDDAYNAINIINKDIFYVVTEGPCHIISATGATMSTITAGDDVAWSTTGRLLGSVGVADDDFIIGTALQSLTSSQTATDCLVMVGNRFALNP